jgi:hypothetical protein
MRYTVRKSVIFVVGKIWMPAVTCGQEIVLHNSDVENCKDDDGKITRDSVECWLGTHTGDFQSIQDFSASIELGDDTIDIPWATEEGEVAYYEAAGFEED